MKQITSLARVVLCSVLGLLWVTSARAADKPNTIVSPIVKEEFRITKEDLKQRLIASKRKIAEVESVKAKIIGKSKNQAINEEAWIDHLRKYDILIGARYVDHNGDYSESTELSARDVDNLNKLFDEYLRWRPFAGRVTASKARKTLAEGQDRLKELANIHRDPDVGNNAELEILAKVKADAEKEIKKTLMLADQLNFDLSKTDISTIAVEGAPEGNAGTKSRAPASKRKR